MEPKASSSEGGEAFKYPKLHYRKKPIRSTSPTTSLSYNNNPQVRSDGTVKVSPKDPLAA